MKQKDFDRLATTVKQVEVSCREQIQLGRTTDFRPKDMHAMHTQRLDTYEFAG